MASFKKQLQSDEIRSIVYALLCLMGPALWPDAAALAIAWQEKPESHVTTADQYGDPLPMRALVRMGTVRLRHAGRIESLAFSPDGKLVASAGSERTIRIWDLATGKQLLKIVGDQQQVNAAAFPPMVK